MRHHIFSVITLVACAMVSLPLQAQDYRYTGAIASPIQETVPLTAHVSPRQGVEVQAPRDGVIKEIFAWPGDIVGNSAPLIRLDDSDLWSKKHKLQEERTEYTGHLRRVEDLVEQGLVDSDIWDRNLQRLAQIRGELAILEEEIRNSLVLAPERNTVLWSDLKIGQEIKGADPIYWLGDSDLVWLSTHIDDELSAGLNKDDTVAVFLDDSPEPVLGTIDFISYDGPAGTDVNLYINAPRIGEIATRGEHQILVPIPSKENKVVIPENTLTKDGHVLTLFPVGEADPGKFIIAKQLADIAEKKDGVIHVRNIAENVAVLLDPPEELNARDLIYALPSKEGWSDAYAARLMHKNNPEKCGQGGGCTGNCGQGVGTLYDNGDPENSICLVPAELFEKPALVVEEDKKVPEVPQQPPQINNNGGQLLFTPTPDRKS